MTGYGLNGPRRRSGTCAHSRGDVPSLTHTAHALRARRAWYGRAALGRARTGAPPTREVRMKHVIPCACVLLAMLCGCDARDVTTGAPGAADACGAGAADCGGGPDAA